MCCEVLCIERVKKVPLIYMNKSYNQRGTFCISFYFVYQYYKAIMRG